MQKMIKLIFAVLATLTMGVAGFSQGAPKTYKVVTVVESIVPGGMGRSRIIENKSDVAIEEATTERSNGRDSQQGKVKRKDLKVD
jgi:hypothetical protein